MKIFYKDIFNLMIGSQEFAFYKGKCKSLKITSKSA